MWVRQCFWLPPLPSLNPINKRRRSTKPPLSHRTISTIFLPGGLLTTISGCSPFHFPDGAKGGSSIQQQMKAEIHRNYDN